MRVDAARHILLLSGLSIVAGISLAIFDISYISVPVLLLTIAQLITPRSFARVWAVALCLILEMNSPFPSFVYTFGILAAYFFLERYTTSFANRQKFFGVLICSGLAVLVFEGVVLILNFMTSRMFIGWIPLLNLDYWVRFIQRAFFTALTTSILTIIWVRFYSPRLRGVVIAG